jgi:hypothetical protein
MRMGRWHFEREERSTVIRFGEPVLAQSFLGRFELATLLDEHVSALKLHMPLQRVGRHSGAGAQPLRGDRTPSRTLTARVDASRRARALWRGFRRLEVDDDETAHARACAQEKLEAALASRRAGPGRRASANSSPP